MHFTNLQDNEWHVRHYKSKYSFDHSTSYLGTNSDILFHIIDPDMNISSNLSNRRCQKFETSIDLKTKYDFIYYLEGLDIPGRYHEHSIRISKKGGRVGISILNKIQYKVRNNLVLPKHLMNHCS